jgi:hypothetical protein
VVVAEGAAEIAGGEKKNGGDLPGPVGKGGFQETFDRIRIGHVRPIRRILLN